MSMKAWLGMLWYSLLTCLAWAMPFCWLYGLCTWLSGPSYSTLDNTPSWHSREGSWAPSTSGMLLLRLLLERTLPIVGDKTHQITESVNGESEQLACVRPGGAALTPAVGPGWPCGKMSCWTCPFYLSSLVRWMSTATRFLPASRIIQDVAVRSLFSHLW